MKKKGQALVEFIIILPIFIMLVLGVIDIGNIIYAKITLESQISDVVTYYENKKQLEDIKEMLDINSDKYNLVIENDNEFINIKLEKRIDIITPGLNFIFDNPYIIEVTRSIGNE